jgi:enterochelin esterase-like enzyme
VLELGSRDADEQARVRPAGSLAAAVRKRPTLIGFYVGRHDNRFYGDNIALNREFTADRIQHWFATYLGGHSLSVWATEAPLWLGRALAYLEAPA